MEPIDRRLAGGWVTSAPPGDAATITRNDGISTTASFLSTGNGRLLTVRHEPVGVPDRAVVICSPILAEAIRNQRRELALGWELSAMGMVAVRFHYLGAGHSDGDAATLTFDQLVSDARSVARDLQETTGIDEIAFVGTRIGALVAAKAAADFPDGPLVMWGPPTDLTRYFNELFRARMIGLLKRGERGPGSKDLMAAFASEGRIDIVGNPLAYSLYESLQDTELGELISAAKRTRTLIIQMAVRTEIRPGLAALIERFRAEGRDVQASAVTYDEAWWFGGSGYTVVEVESGALEVIPLTADFLAGTA